MKNVITFLEVVSPEKNANHCAILATVPGELIVHPETIERLALADFPFKEMAMQSVLNVRISDLD